MGRHKNDDKDLEMNDFSPVHRAHIDIDDEDELAEDIPQTIQFSGYLQGKELKISTAVKWISGGNVACATGYMLCYIISPVMFKTLFLAALLMGTAALLLGQAFYLYRAAKYSSSSDLTQTLVKFRGCFLLPINALCLVVCVTFLAYDIGAEVLANFFQFSWDGPFERGLIALGLTSATLAMGIQMIGFQLANLVTSLTF